MRSFTILFSIFLFLHLSSFTFSELNVLISNCSNEYYTEGGIYGNNLNNLLDSLSSDSENGAGFYNLSAGRYPNQVYGIALCRGDVLPLNCTDCIKSSADEILQICRNQTEAVMYSDDCLLGFSDSDIFGRVYQGETPTYYLWNPDYVSEPQLGGFNQALEKLLENLTNVAASGDSTKKYATGSHLSSFIKIYALLQCTPDLSAQDCENCLVGAMSEIPVYGAGRKGGRVVKLSCNLRFENYRFYEITPPLSPSPLPAPVEQTPKNLGDLSPPSKGRKVVIQKQTVTIVVVSIIGGVILIICVWLFLRIRKPKRRLEVTSFKEKDNIDDANSLQFKFETIRAATSYFSDQNKIGQGGFGTVYKGTLEDGQDIAVKRLSRHSEQGDSEFRNEVMLVAQLQHRNLVRLLGFSIRGTERLLIYEFVPNTSLDHFIFDSIKRTQLDWDRRYRIIKGIVKGLLYLHEDSRLRIVHRDMKASNILLDKEMYPKIADFGMARLFIVDQTQGNTSKIVGTYGYMAPEYAMHGQFSVKSDVYSFGVLVLEIVSGQRNNCFQSKENKMEDLLTYAWKNWKEGTYMNIVDPNLENGLRSEIMRCIHIGLLCVQENVTDRPTMDSVLLMLNNNSLSLPIPLQPLFFMHSTIESDHVPLASSM